MPKEQELTLTLTGGEAQALVTLIDLATKAGGMQVAKAALHIHEKLVQAATDAGFQTTNVAQAQVSPQIPQSNGRQARA